jgi:transcriptional regulator with XRE-family HTH domain
MNEPELRRGPLTAAGRAASQRIRPRAAIAIAITNARIGKGWTQEQLAKAAGTRQSRIAELEGLEGNPTIGTIEQVANALGLEFTLAPRHAQIGAKAAAAVREQAPAYKAKRKRVRR